MKRAMLIASALFAATAWAAAPAAHAQNAPSMDDAAIRQFVTDANSDPEYSVAYRTGNTDVLRQAWGGEVLLTMQEDIAAMRFAGQYLDPQLQDIQFTHIEPLGPDRIRVVTLETWLARLYQIGGNYLGYQRQIVENRYLLQRDGNAWHIIEADQDIQGGDPVFRPGEPDASPGD